MPFGARHHFHSAEDRSPSERVSCPGDLRKLVIAEAQGHMGRDVCRPVVASAMRIISRCAAIQGDLGPVRTPRGLPNGTMRIFCPDRRRFRASSVGVIWFRRVVEAGRCVSRSWHSSLNRCNYW